MCEVWDYSERQFDLIINKAIKKFDWNKIFISGYIRISIN